MSDSEKRQYIPWLSLVHPPSPFPFLLLSCYPLIGRCACHISILFMVFLCLAFSSPCPGACSCHQLHHCSHHGPNFPGTRQITALQDQEMPLSYSVYPSPCSRRGYASHGTKEFFVPRSMLVPAHLQLVMPATQPRIASTPPHPHPHTPTPTPPHPHGG